MGKLIHICLGLALVSPAFSQSATNFDTRTLAPETVVQQEAKPAPKPIVKEPGQATAIPSRNVNPDEMVSYLDSVSSVFLSRTRVTDPFGQYQDPEARPAIQAVAKPGARPAPIKATPFADIIALIEINTIMPGTRSFLIKTRSVKQGEVLPLTFRSKAIRAQVVAVSARQIDFKNLDTGETASRKIDALPVGMTPGTNGISAPGMVPDRPDAPILLEAGDDDVGVSE
ncbi:MAG: hypothetical protein EOP83_16290 [Verrucomicrobiaceae bacterium]|nr:MAG: hypothetical protein EOP83_16290 [Verrucomicrobiaceae bacterium]